MFKKLGIIMMFAALTGCASKPEPITAKPFDSSHSFAYNIANQTYLTTHDSPLKDFTPEDIQEAKTSMNKADGGNVSAFIGVAKILTGNFTGVIDVGGGSAANLANSKHAASIPRWIVFVPKSKFKNEKEAQTYILNTIIAAVKQTTAQLSGRNIGEGLGAKGKTYYLESDGKRIGWIYEKSMKDNSRKWLDVSKLPKTDIPAYLYGADRLAYGVLPYVFVTLDEKGAGYEKFLLEVTKRLPEYFYFYAPPLPKAWAIDGKRYIIETEIVPAIYTQGKKYEFIKPSAS